MRVVGALVLLGLFLLTAVPAAAQVSTPSDTPPAADEVSGDASGDTDGAPGEADAEGNAEINQADAELGEPIRKDSAPAPGVETIVITGSVIESEVMTNDRNSVTGFDAQELVAMRLEDVADLAAFTPNLQIVTTGATSPTLFIRGIGLNDFAATSSGAIAVVNDGVAMNSPAIQLTKFFDMAEAGTLRGPQGTGPYRNASGGVIRFDSAKPTGDFNSYVRASFGNLDLLEFEGAVEAPVWEDLLSARAAFGFTQRDGWMKNRCGSLPPFDERVPRTGALPRVPPWSQCGEVVRPNRVSPVPPGLADKTNDRHEWATRLLLRFTPDLEAVETEWLLKTQFSRLDEDTRLGQSIGVRDFRVTATGERLVDALGGYDTENDGGYRDADVIQRENEILAELLAFCEPSCTGLQKAQARQPMRNILWKELSNLDKNPRAGAFNHPGPTKNDVWNVTLQGNVLSEYADVTSITGFVDYDRLIDLDADNSPNTLFELLTDDSGWQVTQEVRVSGEWQGADWPLGAIGWEVGGLFLHEELDVFVQNDFGTGITSNVSVGERDFQQITDTLNGYFEVELPLSEFATLDGGVRYNTESKSIDYLLVRSGGSFPIQDRMSWGVPTGRARFTLHPTEDVSFYLMYNRGWKSGNFNATGNSNITVGRVRPESVNAYEFGGSSALFGGDVRLTGALFYYDYDDYQFFTADNNFGSLPEFILVNASAVEVYGGEAELDVNPWELGFAQLRFGWLESRFLDFTQQQQVSYQEEGKLRVRNVDIPHTGNRVPNSPRFDVSWTVEQGVDLGRYGLVKLRYDGSYRDLNYFDASEGRGVPNLANQVAPGVVEAAIILPPDTIGQKPYWLHNLRLDWESEDGRFNVALWVQNLEDTIYKEFAFDATTFQKTTIYFVSDPRTYGVTLGFRF